MLELYNAALSPVNLPYTILLLLIVLYWLTVVVGLLDVDSLDIDVDVDADLDIDADVEAGADVDAAAAADVDTDTEADIDAGAPGAWYIPLLTFANIGYVPFMIVISFLSLFLWIGAVLGNYYVNSSGSLLISAAIFPVNLTIGIFLTRIVTTPLKKLFTKLHSVARVESLIGKICTVTIGVTADGVGQAEIDNGGVPILVNVRSHNAEPVEKGKKAVVISNDKEANVYFIEEFLMED